MKFIKHLAPRRLYQAAGVATGLALSGLASADDPYTTLVAAADWSSVKTDIVVVFAAVAGVLVIFTGSHFLLRALRGK